MIRTALLSLLAFALPASAWAGDFDFQRIDERARRLAAKADVVGLAVAVIDDGEIVFAEGYGQTRRGRSSTLVTPDTSFRWASVSKSVAAATSLLLAEDNLVGPASPVGAYAVKADLPDSDQQLTLEHVLSHRIGIPRNSYDGKIEDGRSAAHSKERLDEVSRICDPGECHSYQNVAYDLSRDVVEGATGLPYRAVVSERIFEPLGMDTATLSLEGFVTTRDHAKPHNSGGSPYSRVKPTYYRIPAAAGVNSSITDLAKWVQANMPGTEHSLPESVREAMQTRQTDTARRSRQMRRKYPFMRDAGYGLGWRLYNYNNEHDVVAHRGAVQGYRASVLFDPDTRDGVALLWNSNSSRPHGLVYEIMDQSYGYPKKDWTGLDRRARQRIRRVKRKKVASRAAKPELTPEELAEKKLMEESLAATVAAPVERTLSGSDE